MLQLQQSPSVSEKQRLRGHKHYDEGVVSTPGGKSGGGSGTVTATKSGGGAGATVTTSKSGGGGQSAPHKEPPLQNPSSSSSQQVSCCTRCDLYEITQKILLATVLFGSVFASVIFFDELSEYFMGVIHWVGQLGVVQGSLTLSLFIVLFSLLLLPCVIFNLGAGFLYGWFWGSMIVHLSSTLAAFCGFLTSRYLARSKMEKLLGSKNSKWRGIDKAIKDDGFKVVFLVRFSPLHPYGLCNYLFGLTSVHLRDYMLGSFLGMFPATILEVYLGTAVKDVTELLEGKSSQSAESRTVFWIGFALTILVSIYLTYWIKKKLDLHLEVYESVELNELTLADGNGRESADSLQSEMRAGDDDFHSPSSSPTHSSTSTVFSNSNNSASPSTSPFLSSKAPDDSTSASEAASASAASSLSSSSSSGHAHSHSILKKYTDNPFLSSPSN